MKRFRYAGKVIRLFVAIAMVSAVGASLWFASPVKAVEVSIQSMPSTFSQHTANAFFAQVKVNLNESIPISGLRIDIDGPTPIFAIFDINGTITSQSGQFVGITPVSVPYYGYGYRYGSGYGYQPPTGYSSFESWWGYGYGYGYGYGGNLTTEMKYLIIMDSTSMALGTYTAQFTVTTLPETKRYLSPEYSFLLQSETLPVVPGIIVQDEPEAGTTDLSESVDDSGSFTETVTAQSEDDIVGIAIDNGTTGVMADGVTPVTEITIVPMSDSPELPVNTNAVALTYNIGPDGATFDKPVTICIVYDETAIPDGVNESEMVICIWDTDTGTWVELDNCVVDTDTHTVCTTVTHFSVYTALVHNAPAEMTVIGLSVTPRETEPGDTVTIKASISNTGDLSGTFDVELKINNKAAGTKSVTLAGNSSTTVTFTVEKEIAGTYLVDIGDCAGSFIVKEPVISESEPEAAAFVISSLTISPDEVDAGDAVTVSVVVTNTGELEGTEEVILQLNGEVVSTEAVTLAGGTNRTVTFNLDNDTAGTHAVDVNGQRGSFTVNPVSEPTTVNWSVIAGITGGIVLLSLVVLFVVRRRRL